MNKKGSGKWQVKIIEYLHGTPQRYTPAALRMCLKSKYGVIEHSLAGLLETGAVKADPWRTGYVYRSPHSTNTADVVEVMLRPQIVVTKP